MSFGLVIFDCDGVLVDSEPISKRVFTQALADYDIIIPSDEFSHLFLGKSIVSCIEVSEKYSGTNLPPNFHEDYHQQLYKAFEAELTPIAGVTEVLQNLSKPVCVASSGTYERIAFALNKTSLSQFFGDNVFSAEDPQVAHGKPAPDLFLHAAQKMGVTPDRCAVIEDSVAGMEAGLAAGMTVFGFTNELHEEYFDSVRNKPIRFFDDMGKLNDLLIAE